MLQFNQITNLEWILFLRLYLNICFFLLIIFYCYCFKILWFLFIFGCNFTWKNYFLQLLLLLLLFILCLGFLYLFYLFYLFCLLGLGFLVEVFVWVFCVIILFVLLWGFIFVLGISLYCVRLLDNLIKWTCPKYVHILTAICLQLSQIIANFIITTQLRQQDLIHSILRLITIRIESQQQLIICFI